VYQPFVHHIELQLANAERICTVVSRAVTDGRRVIPSDSEDGAMAYDLKIRGGTIVDGTGASRFEGDLGVRDGKIVDLGDAPESAVTEIDASGKIVSPGFIDIHTHYDAQIVWDPMLSHSPWHGVTTVVMGNCGVGFAPCREQDREFIMELCELVEGIPYECLKEGMGDWGFETFPQYLDYIDRRGVGINVVANVGHHPMKIWVMGQDATSRFASAAEMAEQRRVLREALEAGAQGMSVFNGVAHWGPGGKPVPSRLTLPEQYDSFMQVIDEFGRGGIDVNNGPGFNTKRALEVADLYNITWNHSPIDPDTANEMVNRGIRWHPQLSVLPNSFEVGLEDPFMFAIDQAIQRAVPLHDLFNPLEAMTPMERLEQYKRSEFRAEFVRQTSESSWVERYWPTLIVSYYPDDTAQEGKRLIHLAEQRGVTPGDVMLDQAIESKLEARWIVENRFREPEHVLDLFKHNRAIRLGNGDAGAHQGQIADYRWPTVMLSKWVRDYGLSMERAIQLMSGSSAASYGLIDRGTLTEGFAADVVVFDPDTVQDGPLQRVSDLPGGSRRLFSDAEGIDYVIVNGTVLRDHGTQVVDDDGPYPGQLLRDVPPNTQRTIPEVSPVNN